MSENSLQRRVDYLKKRGLWFGQEVKMIKKTTLKLTTFEAKFLVDALNYCKRKLDINSFIIWGICDGLEKKVRSQIPASKP